MSLSASHSFVCIGAWGCTNRFGVTNHARTSFFILKFSTRNQCVSPVLSPAQSPDWPG
jgi:hypothetical protein